MGESRNAAAGHGRRWADLSLFKEQCAGSSAYEESILAIAQNPPGHKALLICAATLIPEDDNKYDANAVAVYVDGVKVGHLQRDRAVKYRKLLDAEIDNPFSPVCKVGISNGLVTPQRSYSYTIELDIDLDRPTFTEPGATDNAVKRLLTQTPLVQLDGDLYRSTVWLDGDAMASVKVGDRLSAWHTEKWDSVVYFLKAPHGIGLGFQVLSISKSLHAEMFGVTPHDVVGVYGGAPTEAVITDLEGRFATVLCGPKHRLSVPN